MWLVDLCPGVDELHWIISVHYALLVINGKLSLTDKWSAGCAEMRKSGSVRNALWAKPCCNAPSTDISFADQSI
jgi:hypothetical protein